jgi:AcrR family transcriptional regulator
MSSIVRSVPNKSAVTQPHDVRPRQRRTQQQRREGTIAKLIDATIDALAEVGFIRATVKEICARAGVSDGGLFRHFDTRLDLIVAAAERIANDSVADFHRQLAAIPPSDDHPLVTTIRLLRDETRRPRTRVWHELLAAARTDEELRHCLEPATRRYVEQVRDEVAHTPGVVELPPSDTGLWLALLLHLFDGEAIFSEIAPDPESEERLLAFVTQLVLTSTQPTPSAGNGSRTRR